jgi:hypothetical protein
MANPKMIKKTSNPVIGSWKPITDAPKRRWPKR